MGRAEVNLLLDTHVWLWSHTAPQKLSTRARSALSTPRNELWLSPISIWEFLLLAERGRVRVEAGLTPEAWVREATARAPLRDAPLTRDVVWRSRSVVLGHDDPADRFLAATAAEYSLVLVTADERLLAGKGFRTLAAG
jgi:PIN domain nuclease of toxin-antitoxin system